MEMKKFILIEKNCIQIKNRIRYSVFNVLSNICESLVNISIRVRGSKGTILDIREPLNYKATKAKLNDTLARIHDMLVAKLSPFFGTVHFFTGEVGLVQNND